MWTLPGASMEHLLLALLSLPSMKGVLSKEGEFTGDPSCNSVA